jgi:hypothetical protein
VRLHTPLLGVGKVHSVSIAELAVACVGTIKPVTGVRQIMETRAIRKTVFLNP